MFNENGLRFAEYYKLGFYGRGIPAILRGKEYIYRGVWPRDLMSMREMLSSQFKEVQWVDSSVKLEDIIHSDVYILTLH
jgi:hypothetical protein